MSFAKGLASALAFFLMLITVAVAINPYVTYHALYLVPLSVSLAIFGLRPQWQGILTQHAVLGPIRLPNAGTLLLVISLAGALLAWLIFELELGTVAFAIVVVLLCVPVILLAALGSWALWLDLRKRRQADPTFEPGTSAMFWRLAVQGGLVCLGTMLLLGVISLF